MLRLHVWLMAIALCGCGTSITPDAGSAGGGGSAAAGGGGLASAGGGAANGGGTATGGGGGEDAGSQSDAGLRYRDAGADSCAPRVAGQFLPDAPDDTHTSKPLEFGVTGPLAVIVDSTVANPDNAGQPVSVIRPVGSAPYPVLFYSHPFGGTDVTWQLELFKRLASHGYNVVFVPYPIIGTRTKQYDTLWHGFLSAVSAYGAQFELTRVGFVGHSFGGGASPELARRAFGDPAHNGLAFAWGSAGRLLFIMAPWYSFPNLTDPTADNDDYHQLPDDVRTVIQLYADDDTNDPQIAYHDIWLKLPPTLEEKDWQVVFSDQCGSQVLNAGHTTPTTRAPEPDGGMSGGPGSANNGHDEWATARHLQALADYALKDGGVAAHALAFPETAEALSLGSWDSTCGNRPVNPMLASQRTPFASPCAGDGTGTFTFTYGPDSHCKAAATADCR